MSFYEEKAALFLLIFDVIWSWIFGSNFSECFVELSVKCNVFSRQRIFFHGHCPQTHYLWFFSNLNDGYLNKKYQWNKIFSIFSLIDSHKIIFWKWLPENFNIFYSNKNIVQNKIKNCQQDHIPMFNLKGNRISSLRASSWNLPELSPLFFLEALSSICVLA